MPAVLSLLDVNVLIAMLDAEHTAHRAAVEWFGANGHSGWASCPLTQNGCLRIMSQPAYPGGTSTLDITNRLRSATAHSGHTFWPDDISILDDALIDMSRVHGPKQLTDVYLLALAVRKGGRLVTLDGSIPLSAVKGAKPKHLVSI